VIQLKEEWYLKGFEILQNKYRNFYPELDNQSEILNTFFKRETNLKKPCKMGLGLGKNY